MNVEDNVLLRLCVSSSQWREILLQLGYAKATCHQYFYADLLRSRSDAVEIVMSLHTMCCQLLSSTLFIFATFVATRLLHSKKVLIHVCLNLSIGLSQPSTFNTASCPSTSDEKKGEALIMPLIVHESCTDRT